METNNLRSIWPEWEIVRPLGEGAYGSVYEAVCREGLVESRAAVKILSIPRDRSELNALLSDGMSEAAAKAYLHNIVRSLSGEIQLIKSFKGSQNIVRIEDYKVVENTDGIGWTLYIRMELLTSLNDCLRRRTMTEQDVIRLGVDICTALERCAMHKVIHRDIKPENIFVNASGVFKLGDIGIARNMESLTGGVSQTGAYSYTAPEIARGASYDATVDLYSLGLVLHRLMNRQRPPFLDTEAQSLRPNKRTEALRRRLSGEPIPAPCDASPDLARVILRACDPDPARRFSTPTAMKNALLNLVNTRNHRTRIQTSSLYEPDEDAPDSAPSDPALTPEDAMPPELAKRTKRRSRAPVILVILLLLALAAAGGMFIAYQYLWGSASGTPAALLQESRPFAPNGGEADDSAAGTDPSSAVRPTSQPFDPSLGSTTPPPDPASDVLSEEQGTAVSENTPTAGAAEALSDETNWTKGYADLTLYAEHPIDSIDVNTASFTLDETQLTLSDSDRTATIRASVLNDWNTGKYLFFLNFSDGAPGETRTVYISGEAPEPTPTPTPSPTPEPTPSPEPTAEPTPSPVPVDYGRYSHVRTEEFLQADALEYEGTYIIALVDDLSDVSPSGTLTARVLINYNSEELRTVEATIRPASDGTYLFADTAVDAMLWTAGDPDPYLGIYRFPLSNNQLYLNLDDSNENVILNDNKNRTRWQYLTVSPEEGESFDTLNYAAGTSTYYPTAMEMSSYISGDGTTMRTVIRFPVSRDSSEAVQFLLFQLQPEEAEEPQIP